MGAASDRESGLVCETTDAQLSRARAHWTAMFDDPTHPAQIERVLEGMRKAGVPEQ
jgi:hypothetical protein